MNFKRILTAVTLSSLCFVGASADLGLNAEKLPTSWYTKPEDLPPDAFSALLSVQDTFALLKSGDKKDLEATPSEDVEAPGEAAGSVFGRALGVHASIMDQVTSASRNPVSPPASHPGDRVPWRMTFFTTELSVSAQGLLGLMTARGVPQVIAMWRKQGPLPPPASSSDAQAGMSQERPPESAQGDNAQERQPIVMPETDPVTPIVAAPNADDMLAQMEPSVQAALAAGKLQEGPDLRHNLHGVAERLQELTQALESMPHPGTSWWVSSCRFDVILDVSGRLGVGGPTGGVETRLRFDWRRIQRKGAVPRLRAPATELGSKLQKFAVMMAEDLEQASSEVMKGTGYEPFNFLMGFGVSTRGSIGLVTGSVSLFGQLVFARDAKKPVVRPQLPSPQLPAEYVMLEHNAPERHLQAAAALGIPVEHTSKSESMYRVSRARVRKGLKKAAKIAAFFARHAPSTSAAEGWKIYILRLLFDWSLTGDAGLVAIGGQSSTEIRLYNENF